MLAKHAAGLLLLKLIVRYCVKLIIFAVAMCDFDANIFANRLYFKKISVLGVNMEEG